MTMFRKNYSLKSFKGWDHQLNKSVLEFKNTFGVFPNVMLANEVTYKRVDISADKTKILGEKGNKVCPYEYVRLGGFGSEDYELDFCLDNRLEDKAFILILDNDPEGKNPLPDYDEDTYAIHTGFPGNKVNPKNPEKSRKTVN